MEENPWHPRLLPYMVFVGMLVPVKELRELLPVSYLVMYTIQCSLVAWLLWRYRKLMPELNMRFHWASVPVGVVVAVIWVWMGLWMVDQFPERFAEQDEPRNMFQEMGLGFGWVAFSMRLLGMSILVPLFEEVFVRSLLLRAFSSFKATSLGFAQIVMDIPVIGEWLMHTSLGHRIDGKPTVLFGRQFKATSLGVLTLFGVSVSTLLFTVHHHPRDWPAAVVCGIAYCLLLAATRRQGLGPVCWAHGITNFLLWVYTVKTNDWQFL